MNSYGFHDLFRYKTSNIGELTGKNSIKIKNIDKQ